MKFLHMNFTMHEVHRTFIHLLARSFIIFFCMPMHRNWSCKEYSKAYVQISTRAYISYGVSLGDNTHYYHSTPCLELNQ